jgi:hypothetical protein
MVMVAVEIANKLITFANGLELETAVPNSICHTFRYQPGKLFLWIDLKGWVPLADVAACIKDAHEPGHIFQYTIGDLQSVGLPAIW